MLALARRREGTRDVVDHDAHAPVGDGPSTQPGQRALTPADDRRVELDDGDLGARRQVVERRAQGVSHAQAAEQHARPRPRDHGGAGEARQVVLGSMRGAGHQHAATDRDQEVIVAALP